MRLFSGEKPMRMAWKLEKAGASSCLFATAHFFPHSFNKTFTRRIRDDVDTVLFEGPLDEPSMEKVRQYGQDGHGNPCLSERLDPLTVRKISRKLSTASPVCSLVGNCLPFFASAQPDLMEGETKGFRPWMTFFSIWSAYLRVRNWNRSTDMEAYAIALSLGKKVHFLETIEEQLEALDGIPEDGIVRFLKDVDRWDSYIARFVELFMKGDLETMVSSTTGFPTRCPSIVANRDPVMFERMLPFVEKGRAMVLVGTIHIPGIKQRFVEAGWKVTQVTL